VAAAPAGADTKATSKADLSSLTSLLQSRWKGNGPAAEVKKEPLRAGQIRSFRIVKLDTDSKRIEVELS
jgi:small subunit ribosomal protein S1